MRDAACKSLRNRPLIGRNHTLSAVWIGDFVYPDRTFLLPANYLAQQGYYFWHFGQ